MGYLKKSIESTWAPALLLGCLLVSSVAPARSEGFPGYGDRVKYADSLPHFNLGNRYLAKEWWEKAVESYHNAIAIYPYDADVYTNLGIAFRKMNDLQNAERAYKQATELKKDDWVCWSNLANLYAMSERFKDSLDCFDHALKASPPAEEKEAILKNIDGIKKIMKAKGATGNRKAGVSPKAASASTSTASTSTARSGLDRAAYDSWLGN